MLDFETDGIELLQSVAQRETTPFDTVYPLGYRVFDESLLGGARDGDLIVVSGISGHGKTSFAQSLTLNLSKQSIPCLWFSYEVNLSHIQRKFDNMLGNEKLVTALPIYAPTKTTSGRVDWIAEKIREGVRDFSVKCVFIDHLDFLMPTTIKNSENEALYLRRIVMELKGVAMQEGIVIFLMAHVKKVSEEPQMSDIANSAAIFQNADVVFMVYRIPTSTSKLVQYSGDLFTNQTKIKMVKNRVTGQSKFILCVMENDMLLEETSFEDLVS
jgi:replicative DNA helicase